MRKSQKRKCPFCAAEKSWKHGFYYVRILKVYRQRYRCQVCRKYYSSETTKPTYRQKRPDLEPSLKRLLVSGVPQRGAARLLKCSKTTIERKFIRLTESEKILEPTTPQVLFIDEMESIEHTKLKPLTIPIAVGDNYRILGAKVGRIPAKGHLASISRKKYGDRPSERAHCLRRLMQDLKDSLQEAPKIIRTDQAPIYRSLVKEYFPDSKHETFNSRALIAKKKELLFLSSQKKMFDPLFPLNQRCAKLRADVRRLTRRSWCTTKKPENLERHLTLYRALQSTA